MKFIHRSYAPNLNELHGGENSGLTDGKDCSYIIVNWDSFIATQIIYSEGGIQQ